MDYDGYILLGYVNVNGVVVKVLEDKSGVKHYECPRCKALFFTLHDIVSHFRGYEAVEYSKRLRKIGIV